MSRVRVPTPLHGWRVFLGEVGVIVLGVLVALGAQQLVEDWRWRGDVGEFRAAVRDEVQRDLGTHPYRAAQKECIARRLDELERWLDAARAGRAIRLTRPIGIPASLVIRTSAWDSRDAATLSHMPRQEVLRYGDLYSEFANNEVHRLDERAAWIELNSFNGATELSHDDQVRLQGLIFRARLRDRRIDGNYGRFVKRAARSNLRPVPTEDAAPFEPELCRPVLAG